MWIHIVFILLGVHNLCSMQVVFDMNIVNGAMLETAEEVLAISDELPSSSFTGAVTPPGRSSSHSGSEQDAPRGHKRNSTAHQPRTAKPGDIRCFCNMPQCVSTGYLCKTDAEGGCFSDLTNFVDVYRARHGCVDLLQRPRQAECRSAWSPNPTLLLCCQRDLCNHIDIPENKLLLNATYLTYLGVTGSSTPNTGRVYFGSDVWLKAATIAVPICGGFILVVLIVLAVKILRKDSKRQAPSNLRGAYVQCQGGALHGSNQHSKTRLLLEEPSPQPFDKNMAHARLNFNPMAPLPGKQNNVFPHSNNVTAESESAQQPLCKNIITWGNNNPTSASPV